MGDRTAWVRHLVPAPGHQRLDTLNAAGSLRYHCSSTPAGGHAERHAVIGEGSHGSGAAARDRSVSQPHETIAPRHAASELDGCETTRWPADHLWEGWSRHSIPGSRRPASSTAETRVSPGFHVAPGFLRGKPDGGDWRMLLPASGVSGVARGVRRGWRSTLSRFGPVRRGAAPPPYPARRPDLSPRRRLIRPPVVR